MGAGDPFDLVGGDVGVVCIHGFTGSPYEMRYLGDALARTGATVRGLLLPGHGTTLDDLERTGWQDWASAVEREIDAMFKRCRTVAVVGQSLGGLLALHAAAHRPELACAVTLAAPLWLGGMSGRIARWVTGPLAGRIRRIPKIGGSDVRDRRVRAENPGYRAVPTRALGQLLAFMRVVDDELPRVEPPVLVLHARRDHTAPVACAARIAERTRARRVRILERSFHLIAVDVERDLVAAEVTEFVTHSQGGLSCVT
ncbi:MAG TPA: alpha/beta fold hydrolase [Kofleriaceae bacterium]|nr:alpha/beta fold hydrolase [Kofleriaceae bacterium]